MTAPFAMPQFRRRRVGRRDSSGTFFPADVARAYGMPAGLKRVTPAVPLIAIVELGGGYYPGDLGLFASGNNLPQPAISNIGVQGASNNPGDDADGEVGLDWQAAAGMYSAGLGEPAQINFIWAPNSDTGFAAAIQAATSIPNCAAVSISWGQAESGWSAPSRSAMDAAMSACQALGIGVFAAAGDSDSGNGGSGNNVDYPASSPFCCGCGGTNLVVGPDGQPIEKVWNDGQGDGTGGGLSVDYPLPAWQIPSLAGQTKRGVPDVAGVADPQTGWKIYINGSMQVIGGTSAVAPMWAGIFAALKAAGLTTPALAWLYGIPSSFFNDITVGGNGAYQATPGQDLCTGRGTPRLAALFAQVGSTPPPPPPPPIPPIGGPTLAQAQGAAIGAINSYAGSGSGWLRFPFIQSLVKGCEPGVNAALAQLFQSQGASRMDPKINWGPIWQKFGPILLQILQGLIGGTLPNTAIRSRAAGTVTAATIAADEQALQTAISQLVTDQTALTAAITAAAQGNAALATAQTAVKTDAVTVGAALAQLQADVATLEGQVPTT